MNDLPVFPQAESLLAQSDALIAQWAKIKRQQAEIDARPCVLCQPDKPCWWHRPYVPKDAT